MGGLNRLGRAHELGCQRRIDHQAPWTIRSAHGHLTIDLTSAKGLDQAVPEEVFQRPHAIGETHRDIKKAVIDRANLANSLALLAARLLTGKRRHTFNGDSHTPIVTENPGASQPTGPTLGPDMRQNRPHAAFGTLFSYCDEQMRNAPTPLAQGYVLKGYRIDKTLGGGGFSSVYLATDLETGIEVVIKEFLPVTQAYRTQDGRVEPLSEETAPLFASGIRRFFEEARSLAKLHHPNIVQVMNFFRAHNTVYMVMCYELGKDLRWYIKRHPRGLSEKFLRTVFPPLLVGLDELHKNGLLHLDVKPANILLRSGGNPLLLDFGAAQSTQERPAGMRTLTAGFAPIEQHSKGHIGPWTDLYAIGASMWACLSGRAPPPATARAVKDQFKGARRAYGRRYSAQILEAIDWCMQMNQLERPQNVAQLLAFLNEEPVPNVPQNRGAGRWLEKWAWWRLKQL